MRLNRFISSAGIASRRKADELIKDGKVTINGQVAAIGTKVNPEKDHIKVNGKLVKPAEKKVYVLLNKPVGYICSQNDPSSRPLINDLVRESKKYRLFSIGRLDLNSEGLILLTNDGDFAAIVGHPSTGPEKTYLVRVRGVPGEKTLGKLRRGISIGSFKTRPCKISIERHMKNTWLKVSLKEGRNRQIKKMFETFGHPVVKIRRIKIGHLTSKDLKPGHYRLLTPEEVAKLVAVDQVLTH